MEAGEIVWLASYPKSGNTWVRILLSNLLGLKAVSDDDGISPAGGMTSDRRMFEHYTGVNSYELTKAEIDLLRPSVYREAARNSTGIFLIKAHDAFRRLPDNQPCFPANCSRGVLLMVRDPLDVAISYAHHSGEDDLEKEVAGMNDPQRFLGGGEKEQLHQFMGDWSAHYRSWIQQNDIPVCVVRYEDLQVDAARELKKIVKFIGIKPPECALSIEQAVEASRFDRLQKIESAKGFQERPAVADRFFRSGRSGEGRETMPDRLQRELIAYHGEVMRELGYLEEHKSE
ncbi:sulfotransferase domain-containing protein [Erythrobacter sp. F6033]|uniref:sulfotransferase domain-containing protein n=1 Tax=Erythrobacter sp. F6033 TaxID=2926401 RepID=UPI001FF5A270|nr:sulfotransferase domain-containing protein [Erythrobacter sp. F6033]MCK0127771.1 sulfotransferase domain-containing protein [Erythrobacter sp. F6033]